MEKHGTITSDNHAALWHGRFQEGPDAQAVAFETSIHVDERMALDDIRGSRAHAKMLGHAGIIPAEEAEQIIKRNFQYTKTLDAAFEKYPSLKPNSLMIIKDGGKTKIDLIYTTEGVVYVHKGKVKKKTPYADIVFAKDSLVLFGTK